MKVVGDDDAPGTGTFLFSYVWPYPIFPFAGGILAGAMFHLHRVITNQDVKQGKEVPHQRRETAGEDNILSNKGSNNSSRHNNK